MKQLPSSIYLDGIRCDTTTPSNYGAYADIFRTTHGGRQIAIKRLRGVHTRNLKTQMVRIGVICIIYQYLTLITLPADVH